MAKLTLDGVTKVFDDGGDDIVAVDSADVDIDDGEFLVLVGPSGCGKSTTLRMIAGLETVSTGEIRLGETVINDQPPTARNIAMVFQSYALYPHMTVRQNMSFGLEESTDMPKSEITQTVEDAAEMLGIADLLDRKPGELSGGQQQRVALGRAIVRDPEVFLMDEPLSNLDAKLRSQMRTELQRLQEDLGVTTVYVTHDQTEAMTMGDKIAILNDGKLQQVATPIEAYHQPANRFVAGFIGEPSMNFFEMERNGDSLVGEWFEYPLSSETAAELDDAERVTLGVRPEDVELVASGSGDHEFRTVVDVVEPMGNENNVYLRFAGGDESKPMEERETFVATLSGMRTIEDGQEVIARIPEEAIHLFDAETGTALRNRRLDQEATIPNR
ncbi:ABC transporter related protein [Haladaptatus paucihalophilus DX253]|uniref:ABC-type D-xylose/L-arabinose transporter n=1 Tax=Haladaptatus paucihalophilus DX253 TaxID=797209 RepID=E7QRT2_HALPU|nr:sn-glycerol-3-phosphate ABC transporter ATP-binding protein UgpC [Haladaptatus paucihalophilus]EFW92701.1 ABC transporter related protein [Haladaptatus paucihalophilus DX253]SHK15263.1 carbohydrate ABC transporter ATP-binding protein, CUT1 family [Haladaptatus paucihalophilus DX253]